MAEDPDPQRLEALERRIAALKGPDQPPPTAMRNLSQGEAAWRMVIELVTGMGLGLAIGYGLDTLFGTRPILMVIFVLLGLAAGIRTMLRTAAELARQVDESGDSSRNDGSRPEDDTAGGSGPAGDKGN